MPRLRGLGLARASVEDLIAKTIIHPAGPVASALLALADHTRASGRALIDVVNRADRVALRRKVVARWTTPSTMASADVTAVLTDGRRIHMFVEHAIGSLANPMTDAQLEAKFRGMADAVLGAQRCSR